MLIVEKRYLSRDKLFGFLDHVEKNDNPFLTVYLKPYSSEDSAETPGSGTGDLPRVIKDALAAGPVSQEIHYRNTGACVFWCESNESYIVLPPLPIIDEKSFSGKAATEMLRHHASLEPVIWLILITWGSYAVCVVKGDILLSRKLGTGFIHKKHKKGGSSQKRFARRTEEQKKDFLRKVANRIEETVHGYPPDHVFFGGNRLIIKPLLNYCSILESEAARISKRFPEIRYADKESMQQAVETLNTAVVFTIRAVPEKPD
ncbi:MAG: Vms1/Ankzf1 family peptidyl-tRNA hydrolase [Dehalococcoidia bacterium]|nr:Vms1/Ankzf1 family peptidyl-tRNA hydrolase [Dehalococcoidia bacterium]